MYFEFHNERRQAWAPAVDVCERAAEFLIFVEMPGIDRADVKLSWHDGVLTIAGVKREGDISSSRYHCVERNYGAFRRDIALSVPIDHEQASAELRDGVMRICLPKRAAKSVTSDIPIT